MDIEKKLDALREQLQSMPPFHPGKLSQQYVKCGKKNCHCQNETDPKRHGPYYQLSYSINGKKNSTLFIKEDQVAIVKQSLESYKIFQETIQEIVDLTAQKVRIEQLGRS